MKPMVMVAFAVESMDRTAGQKGYVATTVGGGGCVLGIALTTSADDIHLQQAYGVFAAVP
jgi:hypothetical protein